LPRSHRGEAIGFELLTRIRNWKDRTFHRHDRETVYSDIDSLFGEPGQNVIDWQLIRTHWRDLMRIAISIREGRVSSALLLRRLSTESRRNYVYKAFRELGRAICTITLLRLISEPELRAQIDAPTNKVESYNNFSGWLALQRGDGAQRPSRAAEDDQVQHAAFQLRHLPHRARCEHRRPWADRPRP
jgi:TnpA family transposase